MKQVRKASPPVLAVATLCVAASATAHAAQLADLPLEELMRIEVVSASRKTQRLADVAASMHVITADDIRSSGVRNLPEALRLVPGMDVAQLSASRWGVSTRGFTGGYANKLLVLVDGRSVYSPMFSGVLWEVERVPLDSIERIEVLHGPAGSVWGSNAVNGVINIITRQASETRGAFVDASAGDGGRQALQLRYGSASGSDDHWRFNVTTDRGASGKGASGEDANDAFRHAMAEVRWDRRWGADSRSSLEAQFVSSRAGEPQVEGTYLPPYVSLNPVHLDYERTVIAARHEMKLSGALSMSLNASLAAEHIDLGNRVQAQPTVLGAEANAVWRATDAHEATFGAGLRHLDVAADATDWISFSPAQRRGVEWSLYAQDEWTIQPQRWRMTAGVRVDHNLYTGSHAQPNLRLLYTPVADLALWAGASRASRTPARGEQDGILKLSVIPPGTPQNPGPLPIQLLGGNGQFGSATTDRNLDALELGLRTQVNQAWSFDATAFWHRLADDNGAGVPLGDPTFVATPVPHLELSTIAVPYSVRLRGFEAATDWRPALGWRHQLGLSYLDVTVPADAAIIGLDRQLYATPRWLAQWRSVVDVAPNWRLDARVRHVGARGAPSDPSQHVDAYTALDATLTWRVNAAAELSVGGTNLLRPAAVEFSPDYGVAAVTSIPRRVFLRWRQAF
jgi:iron complex outermembrane receptor protein